MVGDLGYQLTFSYFDEASVSEWRGLDLRLASDLPNIDLVVLPVRKVRAPWGWFWCLPGTGGVS